MGPLNGYRVIELASMGPASMAGMILADMGAEVIRVERSCKPGLLQDKDISLRGKKSLVVNLKSPEGITVLLRMIESADVLIDPFRPGVCEKLGIGPEDCFARNARLVFGRLTGWGQDGPLAQVPGHDLNYLAITGALYAIGRDGDKPVSPLDLLGDMGGGGMLLVQGVLAALLHAQASGEGQVVDAAMVDGSAQLLWMFHSLHALGNDQRAPSTLDGGAHYYDTYQCADGEFISIACLEPYFYEQLIVKAQLDPEIFAEQNNSARWPELKLALAEVIKTRTQAEWCSLLEGTDVCFAPVLSLDQAPRYRANIERQVYTEIDGVTQPAPAPRFSKTASKIGHGAHAPGEDTEGVLASMGFESQEIAGLRDSGVIA